MRRWSIVLLMIVALMMAVGTAGCGEASKAALAGGDQSPEAILAAAMAASENMTEAAGSFDVNVSIDADTSQMPEQAKAYLDEPMVLSGTFAYADEPRAGDFDVSLTMAGETMDVGIKLIDNLFWLAMGGQWYEGPAEMSEMMNESFQAEAKLAEIKTLMDEMAIDPLTWLKDLRLVGEETIGETEVYHLSGAPDMAKIMTDMMALLRSEEFLELVDPSGSMTGSMGMGDMMPDADETQEMQTQVSEMFKDLSVDLWVEKAGSLLRKAAVTANMVPPAGEETGGVNGIAMEASVSLDGPGGAVTVEPPTSALPFDELQRDMEENPEMFMGPFMGLMGGFGAGGVGFDTF